MLDILYQRRSIRKYQDTPIEEEKVQKLIKAALLAPSAKAIYSPRFVVVNDREVLNALSTSREMGSSHLRFAPLAIVVTADSNLTDMFIEDSVISGIIIHLTAQSLGLGSCWIQIRNRHHNSQKSSELFIQELLNLPENMKVQSIISIGYPLEEKPQRTDDDIDFSRVYYNRFE